MIEGSRIQYLTHAGVIFIVYMFISVVFFFAVSPVVDGFFDNYQTLQVGDATTQVQSYGPVYSFAVKTMIALSVAIPTAWFIFWSMSREPSQYKRRYF